MMLIGTALVIQQHDQKSLGWLGRLERPLLPSKVSKQTPRIPQLWRAEEMGA